GNVATVQGDYASAHTLYEESLGLFRELGDKGGIANALQAFAALSAAQGQEKRVATVWGAVERLREEIGAPLPPNEREDYDRQVSSARLALGEEAFAAAWAEGRTMTLEQAIELALKG